MIDLCRERMIEADKRGINIPPSERDAIKFLEIKKIFREGKEYREQHVYGA